MIRAFIGYDSNESIAWHVASSSLLRRASCPVSITGLFLRQLPLTRKPEGSTEFSFSRFLVPWLCNYEGYSIFTDCDVLWRGDIVEMLGSTDPRMAVSVVKHDYVPLDGEKFLGHRQTAYPRKNWSSVMVFNNALCKSLTPELVNRESGAYLHQFEWLDDALIGELDPTWNHLVAEQEHNPDAKLVHFTLGTPCFAKYRFCEFSDEWHAERERVMDYNRFDEYGLPEREAA